MVHYIIVKFSKEFDYLENINEITDLFNEALKLDGVNKINIYTSNSKLNNRSDLMIKMELTAGALNEFDNSWIHKKWKDEYGKYIENKTIFDCE